MVTSGIWLVPCSKDNVLPAKILGSEPGLLYLMCCLLCEVCLSILTSLKAWALELNSLSSFRSKIAWMTLDTRLWLDSGGQQSDGRD